MKILSHLSSLETWVDDEGSYLGSSIDADLTEDYDTGSTILSVLVGAVNTTNAKVNSLVTRVMGMQSALETHGILASPA